MNKLLKLRAWLTVSEAAKRLTTIAQEDFGEADILRLALDGHLTLSVNFVNHATGRPVRIEPLDQQPDTTGEIDDYLSKHPSLSSTEAMKNSFTEFVRKYRGDHLPNGRDILIYEGDEQKPVTLEGVWDLVMLGAEVLDIEHEYQGLSGGPAVELVCLGGPLVTSPDRKHMFQLLDNFRRSARPPTPVVQSSEYKSSKEQTETIDNLDALFGPAKDTPPAKERTENWDCEVVYYPAAGLPEDRVLVVRTAALRELERKLLSDEEEPEKALHNSERKSVAQIIATLAAEAGIDISTPYAADEILRAAAATHGLELPSSPETVVKFLKAAAMYASKS